MKREKRPIFTEFLKWSLLNKPTIVTIRVALDINIVRPRYPINQKSMTRFNSMLYIYGDPSQNGVQPSEYVNDGFKS